MEKILYIACLHSRYFSKGELVIINSDELKALLETGKKNITISRQRTGEYMISTGRKKMNILI